MEAIAIIIAIIVAVAVFFKWTNQRRGATGSDKHYVYSQISRTTLPDKGGAYPIQGDDQQLSITFSSGNNRRRVRRSKVTEPAIVSGKLTYKKTNNFGSRAWDDGRETTTECHVCLEKHFVFAIAIDEAGKEHRCCFRCLRKYGGEDQFQIFIEKSQYAALEVAASEALDQLIKEFPDENRRPFGEKTLRDALECPIGSSGDPWRIIDKIKNRTWTEYDLSKIAGRPDPSDVLPFEPFICPGRFVAVDVETANSKRSSICQICVSVFEDGFVADSWDQLINPEEDFDATNTSIHDIDQTKVASAPNFSEIYPKLNDYLSNRVVVTHSRFGSTAIFKASEKYNLPMINCTWLDSSAVAKKAWPNLSSYNMENLSSRLGIGLDRHIASEDSRAAGQIVLCAIRDSGIPLAEWIANAKPPSSSK
jgi:DNA polymerase III epsilon subunit-like protein